ncbi:MAG: DNA-3-methyladenine glycosylase [Patescibacteria group bacterium]|jgi:DNA-3-methyladenine glycosylase
MTKKFSEQVFYIVKKIPKGKTLTYQEVAKLAGRPRACRAVGNILHTNYDPSIPCQRVIRSDGKLGGYNRGTNKKRELLEQEFTSTPFPFSSEEKGCPKGGDEVGVSFFNQPVLKIAPNLLGKYLVRKIGNKIIAGLITEVEAYDGPHDLACHAAKGRTARTEVMFSTGGVWYVYLVYGMYYMLNIVTGPKDYPAAILIRATDQVSGPGKLTKYFHITKTFNNKIANKKTGLWIEDRGDKISTKHIVRTPRIGVNYAGIWAKKPYRFILK